MKQLWEKPLQILEVFFEAKQIVYQLEGLYISLEVLHREKVVDLAEHRKVKFLGIDGKLEIATLPQMVNQLQ
jgi:hypothetical protein